MSAARSSSAATFSLHSDMTASKSLSTRNWSCLCQARSPRKRAFSISRSLIELWRGVRGRGNPLSPEPAVSLPAALPSRRLAHAPSRGSDKRTVSNRSDLTSPSLMPSLPAVAPTLASAGAAGFHPESETASPTSHKNDQFLCCCDLCITLLTCLPVVKFNIQPQGL